jgi:hypothetical protein
VGLGRGGDVRSQPIADLKLIDEPTATEPMAEPMKPYEQVAELAADLQADGLPTLANDLRTAHEGIFNGTELYMVWRFHVAKAVQERRISERTRTKAQVLWQMLDEELS